MILPAGHSRHRSDAAEGKVPTAQLWHAPALLLPADAENLPEGHARQSLSVELPTRVEYLPDIQLLQVSLCVAAQAVENLPASHLVQLSADVPPKNSRYVPTAQSSQA